MSFTLTAGALSPIPAAIDTRAFRFADGTFCVAAGPSTSAWSANGVSWGPTPIGGRTAPGPGLGTGEVAALYVASNEILSMSRQLTGSASPWSLAQRRSTNDWVTVTGESGAVTQASSVAYNPPGESRVPSMIFDRGVVKLASGNLMALFYGLHTGDVTPAACWPTAYGTMKARVVRSLSLDKGATWGPPTTIFNNLALGRGTNLDPDLLDIIPVPMVSMEGSTVNCAGIAANGSVLCFARSGTRVATQEAPILTTPIYYTVSSGDLGSTSTPLAVSIAVDQTLGGDAPQVVVLDNGVVVLGYSIPGTGLYLLFSEDNGESWGHLTTIDSTTTFRMTMLKTTGNSFLIIYADTRLPGSQIVARPITITL